MANQNNGNNQQTNAQQQNIKGQPSTQQQPQTVANQSADIPQHLNYQVNPQNQAAKIPNQTHVQQNQGRQYTTAQNREVNNGANVNANDNPAIGSGAPQPNSAKLKYSGGGWYQLPNGEKVQGEEEAKQAMEQYLNDSNNQQQPPQLTPEVEPEIEIYDTAEGDAIQALGPKDEKNGAEILRYKHKDGRRGMVDIRAGQVLRIGEDVTQEEAQELLNSQIWKFERVDL